MYSNHVLQIRAGKAGQAESVLPQDNNSRSAQLHQEATSQKPPNVCRGVSGAQGQPAVRELQAVLSTDINFGFWKELLKDSSTGMIKLHIPWSPHNEMSEFVACVV